MKSEGADRTYNLPYNQSDAYWIGVLPAARPPQEMHDALSKLGMKPIAGEQPVFAARCAKDWAGDWQTLKPLIAKFAEKIETGIAVIPGEQQPGHQEFSLNRKMPSDIDAIAASLWLGSDPLPAVPMKDRDIFDLLGFD